MVRFIAFSRHTETQIGNRMAYYNTLKAVCDMDECEATTDLEVEMHAPWTAPTYIGDMNFKVCGLEFAEDGWQMTRMGTQCPECSGYDPDAEEEFFYHVY